MTWPLSTPRAECSPATSALFSTPPACGVDAATGVPALTPDGSAQDAAPVAAPPTESDPAAVGSGSGS